jgi:hypothetical protein
MAKRVTMAALLTALLYCRDPLPVASVRMKPSSMALDHGECRSVSLRFEMLRPLDKKRGKAIVFVHLLDRPHNVVRTFDHPFPGPWISGTSVDDHFDLCLSALPPPLRAGRYVVAVGIYESEWGYRWPLATAGPQVAPREYTVGFAAVSQPSGGSRFRLLGNWNPPEPTGDALVVTRRSANGPVAIRVFGLNPVRLRVVFLERDPSAPGLVVRSTCESEPRLFGAGSHLLVLPGCTGDEIRLEPGGGKLMIELLAVDRAASPLSEE